MNEVNSINVAAGTVARNGNLVIPKGVIIAGVILLTILTAFGGLVNSYLGYVEEARVERLEAQQRQQAVEIASKEREIAYQKYLDRKLQAAKDAEAARIANEKAKQAAKYGGLTESQFQLLAMVTFAESGGQPYEDQVRVAETILKRVASERYPDTLEGVLNQPGQFETVNRNGQVVMGYQKRVLAYSDVTDTCKEAVQEAVNGSNYLPEGGRLEFRGSNGHMTFF